MEHDWKGNVRELENVIERVMLFTETEIISAEDLPSEIGARSQSSLLPDISTGIDLEKKLSELEIEYIKEALEITGGNKTEAAKLLGLSFRSLRHKISKYGL